MEDQPLPPPVEPPASPTQPQLRQARRPRSQARRLTLFPPIRVVGCLGCFDNRTRGGEGYAQAGCEGGHQVLRPRAFSLLLAATQRMADVCQQRLCIRSRAPFLVELSTMTSWAGRNTRLPVARRDPLSVRCGQSDLEAGQGHTGDPRRESGACRVPMLPGVLHFQRAPGRRGPHSEIRPSVESLPCAHASWGTSFPTRCRLKPMTQCTLAIAAT